jgi:hypothetical protein
MKTTRVLIFVALLCSILLFVVVGLFLPDGLLKNTDEMFRLDDSQSTNLVALNQSWHLMSQVVSISEGQSLGCAQLAAILSIMLIVLNIILCCLLSRKPVSAENSSESEVKN